MQNSDGYSIEIFSSDGNQNMRYRVIENYHIVNKLMGAKECI